MEYQTEMFTYFFCLLGFDVGHRIVWCAREQILPPGLHGQSCKELGERKEDQDWLTTEKIAVIAESCHSNRRSIQT